MKRLWTALLAAILLIPMTFQTPAHAAVNISVLIDGVRLNTPQAPVMIQGRVMLPMRSIFEALDASVKWNQKTQTVTAVKDGTTVILKINSKTATINNQTVKLDVPAKNLKGNTMVPVRFVSEALGQKIGWNSKSKTVTITTTNSKGGNGNNNTGIAPVNYVTLRDIGNAGDGRDLQVSFSKSSTESSISHYRVMIVKQSKSLTQSEAQRLSSAFYTTVYPAGSDLSQTLTSDSRDVDGDLIRNNQAYKAYVLAVSKSGGTYALSSASPSLTLTNTNSVNGATNVKANDVSDYGDGRDLQVSFTRAQNEINVLNYRVFAVKTKDAGSFNLSAAKSVPTQNYTTVSKTSTSNTTLSTNLSSSARDTSGELIRNGVAYTLFVQSVSNNENAIASNLSLGSSSLTLNTGSATAPTVTQVTDISDYGDGRDLRISFNKVSNESNIDSYRVLVVKDSNYSSFSLSKAINVSSYNSTYVAKTGNNINNLTLASGAKDVDGDTIRNGVYYRVFVMAVNKNNYNNNVLSAPSSSILLSSNSNVGVVTNLTVTDVNNYNDGRDLQVSFNQPSDRSNISHYRVFVVKSSNAYYFDLSRASNLGSSHYTQFDKTSNNTITRTLNSGSLDVDGVRITNNVDYHVFVMTVAYSGEKVLTSYGTQIKLSGTQIVQPISGLNVRVISDKGNGSDLNVTFNRTTEDYYIDHYRVFVVKAKNTLSSSQANNINTHHTKVNKAGSVLSQTLDSNAKDTDGDLIKNDVDYKIYVLSVGNSYSNNTNALFGPSGPFKLQGTAPVNKATDVVGRDNGSNSGDGRDLSVSFKKPTDQKNIQEYRIFVVKSGKANSFTPSIATGITDENRYTVVGTNKEDYSSSLTDSRKDTDGDIIRNLEPYKVFVLSVSTQGPNNNALSAPSLEFELTGVPVTPPTSISAAVTGTTGEVSDVEIKFTISPNAVNVKGYRVFIVPEKSAFGEVEAEAAKSYITEKPQPDEIKLKLSSSTKDHLGNALIVGNAYKAYVLAVADNINTRENKLHPTASPSFVIPGATSDEATGVEVTTSKADNQRISLKFNKASNEKNITSYWVLFVPNSNATTFTISDASKAIVNEEQKIQLQKTSNKRAQSNTNTLTQEIRIPTNDAFNKPLVDGEYAVIILSINEKDGNNSVVALSAPSKSPITIKVSKEEETKD
ncbi:copper amine oxidase [Bacillus sp. FJAT-18019]|nr:copper amine oxidase [Bacillus sp. FJAT-18019]